MMLLKSTTKHYIIIIIAKERLLFTYVSVHVAIIDPDGLPMTYLTDACV